MVTLLLRWGEDTGHRNVSEHWSCVPVDKDHDASISRVDTLGPREAKDLDK